MEEVPHAVDQQDVGAVARNARIPYAAVGAVRRNARIPYVAERDQQDVGAVARNVDAREQRGRNAPIPYAAERDQQDVGAVDVEQGNQAESIHDEDEMHVEPIVSIYIQIHNYLIAD